MENTAKIYIVRAENRGEPESVICGVYPTPELAKNRVDYMENEYDYSWYDVVNVGPNGADCALYNR